jgi:gamma-glutamylcyclotransferase (GGCT)/AIG2-like uncharacterized protein YtfP
MRKINKRSAGYKTKAELKKERKKLKTKSQMEKKYLIGLCDDYRKNGCLNNVLTKENCKLIGTYSTEPIYNMYDVDGDSLYCAVETNGSTSIKIEIWEVNDIILGKIERNYNYYEEFEGYPQDYKKVDLISPFGKIEMYFTNVEQSEDNLIVNGDWIEYLNYKKVMGNKRENVL